MATGDRRPATRMTGPMCQNCLCCPECADARRALAAAQTLDALVDREWKDDEQGRLFLEATLGDG